MSNSKYLLKKQRKSRKIVDFNAIVYYKFYSFLQLRSIELSKHVEKSV